MPNRRKKNDEQVGVLLEGSAELFQDAFDCILAMRCKEC